MLGGSLVKGAGMAISQDLVRPVKSASSSSVGDCASTRQAENRVAVPLARAWASASVAGLDATYCSRVLSILKSEEV